MRNSFAALAFFSILGAGSAAANDSVGHLAAGGLVLSRTGDIEMRAEDLYVSEKEIRVRYRFFNKSGADIRTLVVFPMPDLPARTDENNYALPTDEPVNFLAFETTVDGRKVAMQAEQRVFAGETDHTELLKSLNVPLAPHLEAAQQAIRALAPTDQAKLLQLGLATEEEYDVGQGMQKYLQPNWVLRSKFYWEQVFPAQKELTVEHRYRPSVGATAGTFLSGGQPEPEVLAGYKERYCTDADFLAAAQRAQKAADAGTAPLQERRIEYILTTGANWAGPIGDFRLVVDKGAPGNLVSFCATGVKKIGPTQFEVTAKNYTPARNLEVLILTRGE